MPDMNIYSEKSALSAFKRCFPSIHVRNLFLALAFISQVALSAADTGKTFTTPEEAVAALAAAASTRDTNALRVIFGPAVADVENPDRMQAASELSAFAAAITQTNRIVRKSDSKCVLEVSNDFWPFAVPITKKDGKWFFDTVAGKDEVLSRRIGKNELSTLQSMREYVEAQREYAAKDRDGDLVLEYAQRIASRPGMKDGLYWPPDLGGEISPLGPLAARAQDLGYSMKSKEEGSAPEPFNGYFFKVLTRQSKSAPGGKYDYVINGNMIGGFALVAWPVSYGDTGIMTFIVNQRGRVYQKDLGTRTAKIAASIKSYDPDKTWTISPD
jgi:hypothetical protein